MKRGIVLAAVAYTFWGLLSPGNEILLREYSPMWMQAVRVGLATLIVIPFVGIGGVKRAIAALGEKRILVALVSGTFISFGLFTYSQTLIPAAFTTLGFYTAPLWTALLAKPLLGEHPGWAFVPTVAALLVGGWLALTGGGALPAPSILGMILAIGSGATWGLFAVLVRRDAQHVAWPDLLLASMMLATPLFIVVAAFTEPVFTFQLSATGWTWTFIQVLIPTLAAFGLFQWALKEATASSVNLLVGLELAATVFFAWLLLDATFTALQLVGVAVVLLAVTAYLGWQGRIEAATQDGVMPELPP